MTFRYKQNRQGDRQYSLIAEQIAQVYRGLVGYGDDARPRTVHNLELSALLLNDLQRQARDNRRLADENRRQGTSVAGSRRGWPNSRRIIGAKCGRCESRSLSQADDVGRNHPMRPVSGLEHLLSWAGPVR
jgi:hypothetical protein